MVSAVLPELNFALGFLTSGFSSLNSLSHSVVSFDKRVRALQRDIALCNAQLLEWETTWSYDQCSDDVRRFLWADLYEDISQARVDVRTDVDNLKLHLDRVQNKADRADPAWRKAIAVHRKQVLRQLVYALASESSLTKEIGELKAKIQVLKDLSDQRMNSIRGQKQSAANLGEHEMLRLGNLCKFGIHLFEKLRPLAATSEWALEMRPPGRGCNAEIWDTETALRVWFNFVVNGAQGGDLRRVELEYELATKMIPVDWENRVIDPGGNIQPDHNPSVASVIPHVQKTRSFRTLFKEKFFERVEVRKKWQSDQAHLLLSLCNWAILLWASDWTTDLCCSGIRFVKIQAPANNDPCLHYFMIPPNHVSLAQQAQQAQPPQQNQPQEQQAQNEECYHLGPKLKNIGLTLAEAICAIPFRQSRTIPGHYEKWGSVIPDGVPGWLPISRSELDSLVYKKSNNSDDACGAVRFCLTAAEHRYVYSSLVSRSLGYSLSL